MELPVPFFHAAALFHRLAVVRLQQLTQPRFGVKHLSSQKDKGQHPVVAVLLQGAAADTEQFRHLPVRQVTLPIQRRTVTFQKGGKPFFEPLRMFCTTEASGSSSIVNTSLFSFIIISDSVGCE